MTWEERCKSTHYLFPVLEECAISDFDMRRVYPLQQKNVKIISDIIKEDARVKHACLIGSSISMKCTTQSDIDLIIQLEPRLCELDVKNEVSLKIQEACNWNCDIIWYDRIDKNDAIYADIETGVFLK